MRYLIIAIISVAWIGSAVAQVQMPIADPILMQAGLSAVQIQRNRALDEAASAEAQFAKERSRADGLQHQIDDLNKQVNDLKAKYEPKKEEPDAK